MSASGQARVYHEQGATGMVVASGGRVLVESGGVIRLGTGGQIDASAGQVVLPGRLREGVIPLSVLDAWEVSSADSLNPLTSGTNPAIGRVNAGTDPTARIRWSSGAGATDPIQWSAVLPTDVSTADPLRIQLYGERTSGTLNAFEVRAFFGLGDANAGASGAFSSSPGYATVSIASGDIVTDVPLTVVVSPQSVSGTIDLYGARVVYTRATS